MKSFLTLFLIVILSTSLALAITVDTDEDSYDSEDDLVNISITNCTDTSFLKLTNSGGDSITSKQGSDDWSYSYNTNSDSDEGDYTASVSCVDDSTTDETTFCVGDCGTSTVTGDSLSINTDSSSYDSEDDTVIISITGCSGTSFLKLTNSGGDSITSKQGSDDWSYSYNTNSDSDEGDYTASASCVDSGETTSTTFCVGEDCETTEDGDSDSSSSSGGGGGSSSCTSDWSCSPWSVCSISLEQERTCTDFNYCNYPSDEPNATRSCDECKESWVCSLWSECSNNENIRTCIDEHYCETEVTKPYESKSCEEENAGGYEPEDITDEIPVPEVITTTTPTYVPPQVQSPSTMIMLLEQIKSVWSNYKIPISSGSGLLLLIIIISTIIIKRNRGKGEAENIDQLELYIKDELKSGMSKEKIRKNLESSGWNEVEISDALYKMDSETQLESQFEVPQQEQPQAP